MQAQQEDTSPTLTANFSNEWKFQAGKGSEQWASVDFNDGSWKLVKTDKPLADYGLKTDNGTGWYRKAITLPNEFYRSATRKGGIILHLDSIMGSDTIYLNGKEIAAFSQGGMRRGGNFMQRRYFVDADLIRENNVLAIKFYDRWGRRMNTGGGLLKGAKLWFTTAETSDRLLMAYSIPDDDFIFFGDQTIKASALLTNDNPWTVSGDFVLTITTDDFRPITTMKQTVSAKAGETAVRTFEYSSQVPGFYRFTVQFVRNGESLMEEKFNLGYEPEKIQSPVDSHSDFKAFWENNLKELAKVAPEYKMTLVPDASNKDYKVYLVEMKSLNGKIIRGYYSQPTREGKFPIQINYMGYGSTPYYSNTRWDGFAHYVPSIRGQALNRLTPEDDLWITIGLADKEGYYYQGAFCDVVRAIDFVCSRPEVDAEKIAVIGGSQGGALSFVAAALDKRVKVAAPSIPFLSDYRDYFKIVNWPRSDFDNYKKAHPDMDWEHVYDLLTYFDIKNLAPWITCPLIMSFGMQDETCPPHINFAAYNQVKSEKVWVACARSGHTTDSHAREAEQAFIRIHLGLPIDY
jgi:cephalosporin-C deacetylase-like acetyl esterase